MTDVKLLDVFDKYLDIIDYLKENGWVYTLDVIITNNDSVSDQEVFEMVVRTPDADDSISLVSHFRVITTDGEHYAIESLDGYIKAILNDRDEVIEWLDREKREKTEKKSGRYLWDERIF